MSKYGSNKLQGCFIHIISDRNSAIQITVALMFVKASQYVFLFRLYHPGVQLLTRVINFDGTEIMTVD